MFYPDFSMTWLSFSVDQEPEDTPRRSGRISRRKKTEKIWPSALKRKQASGSESGEKEQYKYSGPGVNYFKT